jgi:ketosteroid isomerase-like protein
MLYMKKTLSVLLLVLFSAGVFAQSSKAKASASKDAEVWSQVEALTKAVFETKDSAALARLVNTNVTYGHSTGLVEDKSTMVHNAVSSATTYRNLTSEKVLVDVDGNTALVRQILRATSIDKGNESPLNLGILQVWKKQNGRWQIWARQAVKIPAKS